MKNQRVLSRGALPFALAVVGICASVSSASDAGLAAADQVSKASYIDFMDNWLYTHAGDDRGYGPEHDLAMDNIAALLESYGLTVTLEPFNYSGTTYYNVVGTKLGTTYPDQQLIVGAHYDSVDNPGADDDASGVALMLEVARIVSQYDSDYTIKFIAFDREEQGLIGSSAYVDAHLGDDIVGMLQADMVAYDPDTNHARLYGASESIPLKNAMLESIMMYGDGLSGADYGWNGQSNHAPFADVGFQACLLIEGEVWDNPYYHTQQDSFENPDNLNFDYAVMMTRSAVGWLVDAAGVDVPYDALELTFPDGMPEYIDPNGGTTMNVQIGEVGDAVHEPGTGMLHYDVGAGWENMSMEVLADDMYEAVFPPADCPGVILYYFSVETTGGEVFNEPRTAPMMSFDAISAYAKVIYFEDDFETDTGWSASGDASTGHWERGVPAGGGERGDPPTDYDGSGQCYLTGNEYGDSDIDDGYVYLDSPTLDLSEGDAEINYALWYTNDYGGDPDNDYFRTYISNDDGDNWVQAEKLGPDSVSGWFIHAFWVGDFVTPTDTVKVRFEASDLGDGSVVEAGVDAFAIVTYDCESPCPADITGDGTVDVLDLLEVLAQWGSSGSADVTGDGTVDVLDLLEILGAWGPC